MFLHGLPSVCVCILISSNKDTSNIGLGPTHMTTFDFNDLFKDPISKHNHIQTYKWGMGHVSVPNTGINYSGAEKREG